MSTFHGLEMAKRALYTQQSALYTTGHNISNANTEGYSRQRVNFDTLPAYPAGSRNRPEIPGQLGQGVQAGSVQRIRDSFLDMQYRSENSKTGYWETMSQSLYRMESLINEPSDSGLANTMDKFWQSLQDLSVNPDNAGARSVVVQRGIAVADTFNYLSNNLTQMQNDTQKQIEVTMDDANSLIRQINSINEQVRELEPHGYLTNDLYDQRDRLIDELSNVVNIKVHRVESADSALDIAGGLARIELVDDNGRPLQGGPVYLVNPEATDTTYQQFSLPAGATDMNQIVLDGVTDTSLIPIPLSSGTLKALVDVYGSGQDGEVSFTNMLSELNEMASVFAEKFNEVHRGGYGLDGNDARNFFEGDGTTITAGNLKVIQDIIDHPEFVAAAREVDGSIDAGNGDNALALARSFKEVLAGNELGDNASVTSFYESIIGRLGVAAQESNRMAANTAVLKSQVEEQRMSVSSVSLDEEMTNMIKFQHAYNAAARSMTAMDEILDRIINNMGLVGR